MDVVQALRSDWHTDPFQFVEKDGYYYGRGTQDMKDSDAALVATFLRLHREGYKPKRDLILALTADEEGGKFNGADWLVRQHRELVDAAFVINPDCRRRGAGPWPRRGGRCGGDGKGLFRLSDHGGRIAAATARFPGPTTRSMS